jgi:hypothetical protein
MLPVVLQPFHVMEGLWAAFHQYQQPIVVFYANRKSVDLLNAAAEAADVLLDPGALGTPMLVATAVEQFTDFAAAMLDLHGTIKPVTVKKLAATPETGPERLALF